MEAVMGVATNARKRPELGLKTMAAWLRAAAMMANRLEVDAFTEDCWLEFRHHIDAALVMVDGRIAQKELIA